jgi:hypothetical protein
MKRNRKGYPLRIYAFTGLAILFLLVLGLIAFPMIDDYAHRIPFDSTMWKDSTRVFVGSEWPPRLCMVDDLLARHRLVGMRRPEIVSLLGDSPPKRYFRNHSLVYWLGPERGFIRMDSEWLAIDIDDQGVVTSAELVRD